MIFVAKFIYSFAKMFSHASLVARALLTLASFEIIISRNLIMILSKIVFLASTEIITIFDPSQFVFDDDVLHESVERRRVPRATKPVVVDISINLYHHHSNDRRKYTELTIN